MPSLAAPTASSSARALLGPLAIVCAVAAAYWGSTRGVFLFDDGPNLAENPLLRTLWPPTAELWAPAGHGLDGRPLVAFSFALNYAWSGLEPWSWHLLNAAIHAGAALALYAVVRACLRLPRADPALAPQAGVLAFSIALLWAVHPLQTASVTYVVQRCESLMGLCFLLALWAGLASFASARPVPLRIACVAAALAGALVKESIAMLPLVLLAFDAAFASGSPRAALRAHRGLYAALLAVWALVAWQALAHGAHRVLASGALAEVTWWSWIRTQAVAICLYLARALWPDPLVLDYGWRMPERIGEWLPQGLLVLGLLAATVRALFRAPRTGVVALSFFLLLAPTSSVLPIPTELVAEHRMYLPLACVIALFVLGLRRAALPLAGGERAGPAVALAACALAVPSILATRARNRDYESVEGMWRATVAARPDNDRAWESLADALRLQGRREEALPAYERAVALHPDYGYWYNNLATLYWDLGRLDEAEAAYVRTLELVPEHALARANLGELQLARGRAKEARATFEAALARDARDSAARRGLARALALAGDAVGARDELRRALRQDPRDFPTFEALVRLLASTPDERVRDPAEALRMIDAARTQDPARRAALERLRELAQGAQR